MELRKWGGSGAWRTTPLPPRSALCSPAHRLAIRTSPPSLFQDAERPDKCSECALPALYIQQSDSRHVRTHPFPPLPLCMLLLLSYTRSRVAARDTCLVGTLCPRNNVDVRVLNLSIGGVARTRSSSSQLSNTGIHPHLKFLPSPLFSRTSGAPGIASRAGGAGPIIIQRWSYSPKTPAPRRGPGLKSHLGRDQLRRIGDKSRYKLDSPKKLMTEDTYNTPSDGAA